MIFKKVPRERRSFLKNLISIPFATTFFPKRAWAQFVPFAFWQQRPAPPGNPSASIWAWGDGGSGQLGNGTTVTKSSRFQVGSLTNGALITASGYYGSQSFALRSEP